MDKNFSVTLNLREAGAVKLHEDAAAVQRFLTQLFHQNVPNFCLQASDIVVTETEATPAPAASANTEPAA